MADTDSENEGILNNIQRLVIRPPGHTGKAKKGHICFDGGHETMNLGRVIREFCGQIKAPFSVFCGTRGKVNFISYSRKLIILCPHLLVPSLLQKI